jgi:hypothetical protein
MGRASRTARDPVKQEEWQKQKRANGKMTVAEKRRVSNELYREFLQLMAGERTMQRISGGKDLEGVNHVNQSE